MYGPKMRCWSSHVRQWELALRNSQEASRRNGVVGNTGRNMPKVASPTHRNAIVFRIIFIFFVLDGMI